MKLNELMARLDLEARSAGGDLEVEVCGGYVSDLISDVLAHGRDGDLWITLQAHQNVVAVASLRQLAGIVLVNGREPEAETLRKAETEGIPILVSRLPAFELAGRLYQLGLRGAASREGEHARA